MYLKDVGLDNIWPALVDKYKNTNGANILPLARPPPPNTKPPSIAELPPSVNLLCKKEEVSDIGVSSSAFVYLINL